MMRSHAEQKNGRVFHFVLISLHLAGMRSRYCLFFGTLLFSSIQLVSTAAFRRSLSPIEKANMAPRASNFFKKKNGDSAALRELKETIRSQANEIDSLKKQLKGGTKSPSSHGGHGAGGDTSADDLSRYLTQPFYSIAFKRVGWLSLFLVSLSMTALIMNNFEHTLEKQLELAYFVPLLAGHGGNTGGQAVGTVLSALSAGTVKLEDAPKVISKEAVAGFMAGSILASAVAPIIHYVMGISIHVSTVIFCTLPLVSTIAATLGSTIPFACIAMGLDPSVIAAPAMTSFVDVSGLMSYFLIANKVFSYFGIEL